MSVTAEAVTPLTARPSAGAVSDLISELLISELIILKMSDGRWPMSCAAEPHSH